MRTFFKLIIFAIFISLYSCSHTQKQAPISIASISSGIMKNHLASFPVYLTNSLESRTELEKKYSPDVFIIHTGHILKPNLSKAENEKTLENLSGLGINLVNLTLEDFAISENQNINFENYKQNFLNSSVIDLNLDSLATGKNIRSYVLNDGVAFIGLSDTVIGKNVPKEKFLIDDYVLAILKVKKNALKENLEKPIKSFIIVHTLGSEINEVMSRLPPSFINSLAN